MSGRTARSQDDAGLGMVDAQVEGPYACYMILSLRSLAFPRA